MKGHILNDMLKVKSIVRFKCRSYIELITQPGSLTHHPTWKLGDGALLALRNDHLHT